MSGGGPSFSSFKVSGPGSTIGDKQTDSPFGGGQLGGGGQVGGAASCEFLISRTKLESPAPEVVSKLKQGDILTVKLKKQVGFGGGYTLIAQTSDGAMAGTVFPPNLSRFIQCMEHESFSYVARIQSIDGGRIIVEIRPASHPNS
jgi:hypothetical protein